MADTVDKATRSRIMAAIRGKGTGPEMAARRALHAEGLRFRLHRRGLPGSPDMVFPRHRAVVFVHGCFWHGHGCAASRRPKSNRRFWDRKLKGNSERDARSAAVLRALGWRVFIVWECEIQSTDWASLAESIRDRKEVADG